MIIGEELECKDPVNGCLVTHSPSVHLYKLQGGEKKVLFFCVVGVAQWQSTYLANAGSWFPSPESLQKDKKSFSSPRSSMREGGFVGGWDHRTMAHSLPSLVRRLM